MVRARWWRIVDGIMLVLFTFSVIVQFNDPDPFRWAAMYGLAAVACALSLAGRLPWWLPVAIAVVALLWARTLAPRVIGEVRFLDMFGAFEMKSEAIEESREMYGLALIAAWMMVLAVRARALSRSSSRRRNLGADAGPSPG